MAARAALKRAVEPANAQIEKTFGLSDRIAYSRAEHDKLLEAGESLARSLALTSSPDFPEKQKGLAGLRALEHAFDGIAEHCHAEDRIVEPVYDQCLKAEQRAQIATEHHKILRLLGNFRHELRYATADRANELTGAGTELVSALRAHVARENEWLGRIHVARPAEVSSGARSPHAVVRSAKPRKRRQVHRKNQNVSYTMEPHLEI
ncbi:MAG TPA: hemerythrin domain-containing protein [Candidatus Acidoferrum sp.]|nr:hemerythrin domain-containing protein [Candidatus Acidoferrum sp.]